MTDLAPDAEPAPADTWRRILVALRRRPSRAHVAVAALCGVLGFALVTQVHATSASGGLTSARPDDLLAILADLGSRADRLRAEVGDLQTSAERLTSGSDRDAAALREAQARARTLGILTGTLGAQGPGLVLTITDPGRRVRADLLVSALQELRDAGAEAIELAGVRVVVSTAIVDGPGGLVVDGHRIAPPYRFAAIGDRDTMTAALGIPGGVRDSVDALPGARATVTASPHLTITALRALRAPRYARPAH